MNWLQKELMMKWLETRNGKVVQLSQADIIQKSEGEDAKPFRILIGKAGSDQMLGVLRFHREKSRDRGYRRICKFLGHKKKQFLSYTQILGR